MTDWLGELIEAEAVVLTANQRLASSLTDAVNQHQVTLGKKAWRPLVIREWRSWLGTLYEESAWRSGPTRIGPHQGLVLWEDALRPDLTEIPENLPALARLARDARNSLVDHRVSPDSVTASASSDDQRIFSQSLRRYLARLENNDWIDDAGIRDYVVGRLSDYRLPEAVCFAGFTEKVPLVLKLRDTLGERGVKNIDPPPVTPGPAMSATFENAQAEMRAAGAWARQRRGEGCERVAIVVSGLDANAPESARLVREGFTPGWQFDDGEARRSVNVSYGRRLSEFPMVAVALSYLRWLLGPASSADVSVLLRTPLIGDHRDADRIKAELVLHDVPDREWTPSLLRSLLNPEEGNSVDRFLRACEDAAEALAEPALTTRDWALAFESALESAGWPGTTALDSEAFQLNNRWRQLLEEVSSLSAVTGRVSGLHALSRLSSLASDAVFQPEQLDSAVDVLGPLEAAGQTFDAVWIAGVTDAQWPGVARGSPLLANRLQREADMRDSSPERWLQHQTALLDQLMSASGNTVVSYARTDGDSELSPSPLLADRGLVWTGMDDPGWFASSLATAESPAVLDETAPPVQPGDRIFGGSRIPELQHGSPFDAFSEGRLGLRSVSPFSRGLGPRIRGILTHDAAYRLYGECTDQQAFAALDESALRDVIRSSVEDAARSWFVGVDPTLRRLMQLESERTQTVLFDVVQVDLARPPFEVTGRELKTSLRHGPVELNFRIDRIDQLPDGGVLLLDYKTGAAKGFVRQDGGPQSFQLVVYSMSVDEPVKGLGLYYAGMKKTVIRGIGETLEKEDQYDQKLRAWCAEVHSLLDAFASGDLRIVAQRPLSDSMDTMLLTRLPELKAHG